MMMLRKAAEFKDNVCLLGTKGSMKNLATAQHHSSLCVRGVKSKGNKAASLSLTLLALIPTTTTTIFCLLFL